MPRVFFMTLIEIHFSTAYYMIHNNKKNMVLRKTKEIVMNYDDETVKGRKT